MLRKVLKLNFLCALRNVSSVTDSSIAITSKTNSIDLELNKQHELKKVEKPKRTDLTEISKILRPGAISSMYINKSDILQQLVKLGVKLYEIEKNPEAMKFILTLKFEDIKDTVIFIKDLGVETDRIGYIITKNPLILEQNLDDLKVRINYLQYKKFSDSMIIRIIENNPLWLTHSVQEIDSKLGFFQSSFSLTGDEVRSLTTKCPKLITDPLKKTKLNTFVIKEEMGFTTEEIKSILLESPKLFRIGQMKLLKTFEYLHNTMKIPLETLASEPQVLNCRVTRLKERHLFLVKLEKVQFDPKKPNYIGLLTLVSGTDAYFSTEVAKSSVQLYNEFLKSL